MKKNKIVQIKDRKNEVWKKVKFDHSTLKCDYYVSNLGRLKSKNKASKSEFLLKGSPMKGGYLQLNVKLEDGHRSNSYVHRLVAKAFAPTKRKNTFVIHKNGNKMDNKVKNLAWANKQELSDHHKKLGSYKFERGTRKVGAHVKMTESKVKTLKKSLKAGRMSRTKLSEKYGITMTQIKRIERGINWGHVKI